MFRLESDLPNKMANLEIMEVDSGGSVTNVSSLDHVQEIPARVLRKRKSLVIVENKSSNRRVNMKPRKRLLSECANPKQIEALYLNKTAKTSSQTLETIYEEAKTENNESVTLIGGRKVKRLLTFQLGNQYTKEKIKKRRAKIKKLLGTKYLNRKKIPMPVFLKTIECLELDESVQPENTNVP